MPGGIIEKTEGNKRLEVFNIRSGPLGFVVPFEAKQLEDPKRPDAHLGDEYNRSW